MKRIIFFFLPLFAAFSSRSQTACQQMLYTASEMTDKMSERMSKKTTASDEDIAFMEDLCKTATVKLNRLAGSNPDKYLLNEYRFCILNTHGILGYIFMTTGLPVQKAYDILEPIKETVYLLDSTIMKEYNYVTCDYQDGSSNVITISDYEKYALYFYYAYIGACVKLGKMEEADDAFNHFKKFDYGMVRDMEYATAGLIIKAKYFAGTFDESLLDAATYAFNRYTKDNGYDSTILTIHDLIAVLLTPQLADSTVPDRAQKFYKLYQDMQFYHRRLADTDFTEEVQQDMFLQCIHSFSDQYGIPDLLESMKYNNHPVVDSIIALNDPVLLHRIINMAGRYVGKDKLREPYFWQSMGKLYRAAGMTSEAEAADKKFKKYKY